MYNSSFDGIINVYKEKDYTSHDVVAIVKKITHSKAGHTGTLDPMAEGVLPVCLGCATKVADYIASETKEYVADMVFGSETDTQDSSGEVISEKPLQIEKEKLIEIIMSFRGEISQLPPMYSALKVNGKKLYELARQGKEVERKPRNITIYELEILKMNYPDFAKIRVLCSKGTYIRTLCRDIGEKAGSAAHMSNLIRTRTGDYHIDKAVKLSDLKEIAANGNLENIIQPLDSALSLFRRINVSYDANKLLYNGNKIPISFFNNEYSFSENEKILAYDSNNKLIGIYEANSVGGFIKPVTIFASNINN